MELREIEDLMALMRTQGFQELCWERGGEKIHLVQHAPSAAAMPAMTFPAQSQFMPNALGHSPHFYPHVPNAGATNAAAPGAAAPGVSAPSAAATPGGKEIRSPFVGTFYSAASPTADPFVEVGKRVKKGQTLCIVEAMKLMNEIEADAEGQIVEILIRNGDPVEYDQVLFRLAP